MIQIRSWNFPQASRVGEGYGGGTGVSVWDSLPETWDSTRVPRPCVQLSAGGPCVHALASAGVPPRSVCARLCPRVNRAVRSCTPCMRGGVRSGIWVSGNCAPRAGRQRGGRARVGAASRVPGSGPPPGPRGVSAGRPCAAPGSVCRAGVSPGRERLPPPSPPPWPALRLR